MSLVTSTPTNNLFYARPHLCPLPRGEDFSNLGLGDLIDCPANPGARIFQGEGRRFSFSVRRRPG